MFGACKKNHGVEEGKMELDGCLGFVHRDPGDSHCKVCGCHVGFHVQPQAAHELAAIRVDPQDTAFGACFRNRVEKNDRNIALHDGCQRFFPSKDGGVGVLEDDRECELCGCPKSMHEEFVSTFAGDAALGRLVPGSSLSLTN